MKKSTSSTRARSRAVAPSPTLTQVRTRTITDSKIMIATLALFLANGLALIGVPVAPAQKMQVVAVQKCGVKSIQYGGACGASRYTGARVVCHDGTFVDIGEGVCTTVVNLFATATRACSNRCSGAAGLPSVERPRITIRTNVDTPLATNLLMGSVDNNIAKFDLSVNDAEDVQLRELAVSFHIPDVGLNSTTGTLRNIRLYDGNVQVGAAVASVEFGPAISTYRSAVFSNLDVRLVKRQTKTLIVKADIANYENFSVSGGRFQPVILAGDLNRNAQGVQYAISAIGVNSGFTVEPYNDVVFVPTRGTVALGKTTDVPQSLVPIAGNVEANQFVAYRAKLSVAHAGDAPSGASVPNANQTIGKFVVTNSANVGNYSATIQYMNFSLSSTISQTGGNDRLLMVYKDSLATTAVWTTSFDDGYASSPAQSFKNTGNTDAPFGTFTDIEISSGSSKTVLVTLNTSDAASTKSLSITIPSTQEGFYSGNRRSAGTVAGLVWSDGVIQNIMAHDNLLPLATKTFTY